MALPKVAFIGTGGTIASLGRGPLDLQDYGAAGNVMHAEEILAQWPEAAQVADVIPVSYRNIPSTAIEFRRLEGAGGVVRATAARASRPRRHRHRPRHRDAGGNRLFPQSDAEDCGPGRAGRRAAAVQRAVDRCRA